MLNSAVVSGLLALLAAEPTIALENLDDATLSDVVAQSLFITNKATNGSFDYYRLAIDAQIDLNANIRRLALGCDGAGATGLCDLDLNNVRLTGIGANDTGDSGPPKDFILRRPYLEFAVKNPNDNVQREISGVRFGAYEALGILSVGENPNINDVNDDTGVSRLTGFMVATVTNARLTDVGVTFLGACCVIGPTTATISSHTEAITLRRANTGTFSKMTATASGITLNNVWLNNEPLTNMHNITVAGDAAGTTPTRDFYISVQKESLFWQAISTGTFNGTVATTKDGNVAIPAAEKGWWMYLPGVQLPNITSNQTVRISTTDAIGGVFGLQVNINPVDLQQRPADNCYGAATFC